MKSFILQQQCPSPEEANHRAEASLLSKSEQQKSCTCPHLMDYLPLQLSLAFIKSETRGYMLKNPIHAAHLASQLDPAWLKGLSEPPVLYGEEQERWAAVQQQGIPEYWHPYMNEYKDKSTNTTKDVIAGSNKPSTVRRVSHNDSVVAAQAKHGTASAASVGATNVEASAQGGTANESALATLMTAVPNSDASNSLFTADQPPTTASVAEESRLPKLTPPAPGNNCAPDATSKSLVVSSSRQIPLAETSQMDPTRETTESKQDTIQQQTDDNHRFDSMHAHEEQIKYLRRILFAKRSNKAASKTASTLKKHRKVADEETSPIIRLTSAQERLVWDERLRHAQVKVQLWMEHFRQSRNNYWTATASSKQQQPRPFGAMTHPEPLCCHICRGGGDGDDVMHCLDCAFVGCMSDEHSLKHYVLKNHTFAVTCGPQAKIYCFQCGDFVEHEVFTLERERIDLCARLPWMGWKDHPLQRSFDALRFMYILDHGIVWKGMAATYPPYVPSEHVAAASMSRWRQNFFHGNIWELPSNAREDVMQFASSQAKLDPSTRWRLPAPVGMYNLGNSCYMSAILQCLIHCIPVQKYFLCDIGHHHMSCNVYRAKELSTLDNSTTTITKIEESCLACELDKLMLNYFDSSTGHKTRLLVKSVANDLETSSNDDADRIDVTGEPLITTSMLTAAWKSVTHLAGYEQRDAHEFLHAFLDALGKHTHTYRLRVNASINVVPGNSLDSNFDPKKQDIFKRLFEGKLRSILVCGKCGNKRTQSEPFMSISLPLAKQVQKAATQLPEETSGPVDRVELSVERCLEHFTCLETLADSVDCPCCGEKTPTRKQHVVSKLPRVLCLHLKRFDAAQNRKIEDYVSFPAKGLNMGPFLPHWCEVSRVPSSATDEKSSEATNAEVLYDLFGTVNHFGNLQSGHYVTNVKVDNKWYHINDAHVSYASLNNGDGEAEVVVSEGAYLLFYIRA